MTNPSSDVLERLPSAALFYRGTVPERLTDEERTWLVEQLHAWPTRVNEARTCAIGALTDMAVTEFCRVMAERTADLATIERLSAELERVKGAKGEALDLTRRIRSLVRAENSRVQEARRRKLDVMDVGARDDADHIQANLYEAWPAKRLDALIAALTMPQTNYERSQSV